MSEELERLVSAENATLTDPDMNWIVGAGCPSSYKVGRQSGLSIGGSGSFV